MIHTLLFFLTHITNPLISLGVEPINEISVQTISLPINIPSQPSTLISQSSYSITTNGDEKKIIGSLDLLSPPNLILSIALQAPSGATSHGKVKLSSQNVTLVSNISRVAQSNLDIIYTFSAISPVLSDKYSKVVRLTLVD